MWPFACQKADKDIRSGDRPDGHKDRPCKGGTNARPLPNKSAQPAGQKASLAEILMNLREIIPPLFNDSPFRLNVISGAKVQHIFPDSKFL